MDKIIIIIIKLIITIGLGELAFNCAPSLAYGLGGLAVFLLGAIDYIVDKGK
jgi:hypothetical protein